MCDDWDELREALRLLDNNKQTYSLRSPQGVDYTLSTLNDDGVLDTENAYIKLTTLRGHIYEIVMHYPFGWDGMNERIYEAYKY